MQNLDMNAKKNKYKNASIIALLVMMYIIVAMSDNFKGIFVPSFKSQFGVNNTQIGYMLTASLFAYAVFQYLGGILIEKMGSYKKVIVLGFIIEIFALLALIFCKNYAFLIVGLFGLNAGMAMFNVSINTLGPTLPVASTAVLMNFLVFAYGVGTTSVQKIVGNLLFKGVKWESFYSFMFIVSIILFAYLLIIKVPKKEISAKKVEEHSKEDINMSNSGGNKILILYILAAGFYLSCEYGTGNWFVNYMSEGYALNADRRALYVALFFGIMTVGRFFGGFIADKFGHFRSIISYGTLAAVITILGMLLKENGLVLIAISGLFYSLIFPVTITTISKVFKKKASYITGLILMCGTLIAMGISMLMGVLNDFVGVYYSYYTIGICLILCTVFMCLIRKKVTMAKIN
ncbi:MFS transporter [Clostridium tyrobutyricum]|uniref:MFS transporter n=1 Tax=Clostridium tyrobutyricum TaxID=1519 RepID=UPI001C381B0B|nr:MFS transporter [Clostridium tyrobutyricum]MBV4418853.1 MFS transporter [Clostridium tyrobutyricum]